MDVGSNPGVLLLIQKCFSICILAVRHCTDKHPGLDDFSSFRINHFRWITRPVNLYLFPGLPVDMHGRPFLLLILLKMVAELGIHERLLARLLTVFKVFSPKQFLCDTVLLKLLPHVFEIRHSPIRFLRIVAIGEKELFDFAICHVARRLPFKACFICKLDGTGCCIA